MPIKWKYVSLSWYASSILTFLQNGICPTFCSWVTFYYFVELCIKGLRSGFVSFTSFFLDFSKRIIRGITRISLKILKLSLSLTFLSRSNSYSPANWTEKHILLSSIYLEFQIMNHTNVINYFTIKQVEINFFKLF